MQKDFEHWMPIKATINYKQSVPTYKEGGIYWLSIGANVGIEQDGKGGIFTRPVLVIKGFSKRHFWGIPLTTAQKAGKYYYYLGIISGKHSTAILSQLRAFDFARVSGNAKEITRISKKELGRVKQRLFDLLNS